MKYFKNLMVIAFVILGLVIASNSFAADKSCAQDKESAVSGEKHKKMEGGRQKVWDQLNLTPEQKKQLEENKAKNKETMKATFEKMKSAKESLKAELMKPALDMNKINNIQSQVKALQNQMTDNRLSSMLEVRKVLTREQFEKFLEITGKHRTWQHKGDKGACKD